MAPKVLLDPAFRKMAQLFPPEHMERLRSFADVVWARDEPAPAEVIAPLEGELEAIVTGG